MRKPGNLTRGLMGLLVGAGALMNGCATPEEAGNVGRDLFT